MLEMFRCYRALGVAALFMVLGQVSNRPRENLGLNTPAVVEALIPPLVKSKPYIVILCERFSSMRFGQEDAREIRLSIC